MPQAILISPRWGYKGRCPFRYFCFSKSPICSHLEYSWIGCHRRGVSRIGCHWRGVSWFNGRWQGVGRFFCKTI